jgi:hypothetical protein
MVWPIMTNIDSTGDYHHHQKSFGIYFIVMGDEQSFDWLRSLWGGCLYE